MANRCHLPVQDTDDSRFRLMEHQIVDLVIAMDQCHAIFWLCRFLLEEGNHFVEMRDVADGNLRVHVLCLSLCLRQRPKCLQLAVVEPSVTTEVCKSNLFDVYSMEFGQSSQRIVP